MVVDPARTVGDADMTERLERAVVEPLSTQRELARQVAIS